MWIGNNFHLYFFCLPKEHFFDLLHIVIICSQTGKKAEDPLKAAFTTLYGSKTLSNCPQSTAPPTLCFPRPSLSVLKQFSNYFFGVLSYNFFFQYLLKIGGRMSEGFFVVCYDYFTRVRSKNDASDDDGGI